jgi:2-polyprenyl-6-hydroxyphenyl methylase/3-demethylubiquinone-9 3-methyltransferase
MKKKLKWQLAQKLEYKWWQNYLKAKDKDQYLQWKAGYWQKVLSEISKFIPLPEDKYILDAGCGPAGVFMVLDKNMVHAIDPLLDQYRALPHFMPERAAWTKFETTPLESLTETEKYDMIFCMNAINHVNEVSVCYDNLVRLLKPGGYLVISTDAHKHQLLKKIFQLIPGDVLHPVQLDNDEYNAFLTTRGMELIESILYEKGNVFDYYITLARKPLNP